MNNHGGTEMVTDTRIEVVQTRVEKIWLREDGIIQIVAMPKAEYMLADAKEGIAGIVQVSKGRATPCAGGYEKRQGDGSRSQT